MEMSEQIGDLATALASVQATIGGAIKGKVNPAFKSKYADLASVWDAWQAVGPAQGLSITQLPGAIVDGKVALTTILAHKSGQWMREVSHIQVGKADAQGYVSAVTYGRRCALAAFVGIAPEDDDGNAAVQRPRGGQQAASNDTGEVISPEQAKALREALDAAGRDIARFCAYYKIDALPDLPAARYAAALAQIAAPRKAA